MEHPKQLVSIDYSEVKPFVAPLLGCQALCPNCKSPLQTQSCTLNYDTGESVTDTDIWCDNCSYWKCLSHDVMLTQTFNPYNQTR